MASRARSLSRAEAESGLVFGGFLVLHCPPKPESAEVLEALRASSHELQMITGDTLLTACQAASELGLLSRPALLLAGRACRHDVGRLCGAPRSTCSAAASAGATPKGWRYSPDPP